MARFFIILINIMLFAGCASHSIKSDEPLPEAEPLTIETDIISDNSSSELDSLYFLVDSLFVAQNYLYSVIDSLESELRLYESIPFIDRDFQIPDKYRFAGHEINLKDGRLASRFEKIFKNELRAAHRYIPLSGRYFPYIEQVLKDNGIHDDIKYLSIAESTLNPNATSHAGAAGIWQFMGQTAKGYGLSINDYIDERRHIHKSTEAAARLLKDNYRTLLNEGIDDWLLAVCAYNAGIGTILRDAKGQGAAEFSKMIMRSEETDLYVYRSLAIKIIFENQKQIFGKEFEMQKSFEEEYKEAELVTKGHHELKDWAKANGTTIAELCEINPWIRVSKIKRSKYTPLNKVILPPGEYKLLIPSLSEPDRILLAKAEADLLKKTTHHYVYYTVRRGDNLSTIARNHGTTISNLRILNNLRSNTIYAGQKLKVRGDIHSSSSKTHIVKSGENLGLIAKRYGMTVSRLKALNDLKSDRIIIGQTLAVSDNGSTASTIPYPSDAERQELSHTVGRGDTLSGIALKYGVSIADLKAANNLTGDNIRAGQKLTVRTKSMIYTVVSGDNLSTIANKFGTTTSKIMQDNNLGNDRLAIGQKLVIVR